MSKFDYTKKKKAFDYYMYTGPKGVNIWGQKVMNVKPPTMSSGPVYKHVLGFSGRKTPKTKRGPGEYKKEDDGNGPF